MISISTCPICASSSFHPLASTRDYTLTGQSFTIKQCEKCELGITDPRPEENQLGAYYESPDYISHTHKASSIFDLLYSGARSIALQSKWNLIKKFHRPRIALDYGAGTGRFVQYLRAKDVEAYGVEPSTKARTAAISINGANVVTEALQDFPLTADIITLWHVLEHVPDPVQTLLNLKSKLGQDGVIFIAVPNLNSWESTRYKTYWAAFDTPRHLWHFNQKSMQLLLKKVGLNLIAVSPMKLDAYYISLLSEKYKNSNRHSLTGIKNAILNGIKSNSSAKKTGEYSSLIYIARNAQ
jgi:SAM-dependent methyltransferase